MHQSIPLQQGFWTRLLFRWRLWWLRQAASGLWPARSYLPELPQVEGKQGRLKIEIVSHCWNYSHLLIYQLSALVLHPPRDVDVILTVFYAAEDQDTAALLQAFSQRQIPGLRWNFQALPKESLFRRSIGRNQAALATEADWIWFTDCDLVCHEGCLDGLAATLQGRTEALVYPREERITALLAADDALLGQGQSTEPLDIPATAFQAHQVTRATGPLQIVHGDVARACGYCAQIPTYQEPMPHFAKCHEDRAFRWLLRSDGVPIDVPAVYRIRHQEKGRYQGKAQGQIRLQIRRLQEWWRALF